MSYDYSIYYKRFHDESETHAERIAAWLYEYLLPDLPTDRSASILDIGCGFGFALRALRNAGYRNVSGLETSAQQADVAARAGFNVTVVDDTEKFLSENPRDYDLILLLDVLEHVPVANQISLLSAICKSLRPGSRLILTVPNANSPLASRWRYNDFTHASCFTEHSINFVLLNAGFGNVVLDNTKTLGKFPSRWWAKDCRGAVRKWLVRYLWMQVFKAEIHESEDISEMCFEPNIRAVGITRLG